MQLVRLCIVTNSSEVSWSDLSFLMSFFFFLIGRICVKALFFHICPFHCPVVSHVTCLNQWRRDLRCYVCLHCLLLHYALPTLPALSFLFFFSVRSMTLWFVYSKRTKWRGSPQRIRRGFCSFILLITSALTRRSFASRIKLFFSRKADVYSFVFGMLWSN